MTDDNCRRNIALELDKGARSYLAAELCLGAGLWDDAVSRAYYAALHHVTALLFSAGLEAKSHGGAHDIFYLHFIREGPLPARLAKLFAGLQKFREQADYARAFQFTEEGAREEVEHAKEICEALRGHLHAGGWISLG